MNDADMRELQEQAIEPVARIRYSDSHVEDERWVVAAFDWIPDALDRLERLRALHVPEEIPNPTCKEIWPTINICRGCPQTWPCPTIQILNREGIRPSDTA